MRTKHGIHGDCWWSPPQLGLIVKFVRKVGQDIAPLFAKVLTTCDRLGLIGKAMFAVDEGTKSISSKDAIQGCAAQAAVDSQSQIIAAAGVMQASGRAFDYQHLFKELKKLRARVVEV